MAMFFAFIAMWTGSQATLADESLIDFQKQVAPILSSRCVGCHQPGKIKGGLDLTTFKKTMAGGESGSAIEPGKPAESELVFRIKPESSGMKPDMPRQGEPLSANEVSIIEKWIAQGAKWPETQVLKESAKADQSWWSLQKLSAGKVPDLPHGFPDSWKKSPIDQFIASRLQKEGLEPSPAADRRILLRRLYYDLTGLPASPQEMQSFLNDQRPDAYLRQVDRLLASPRYGERWGRYWLDVVRFGESNGFERNELFNNVWPFRDYVIRSFNEDKPFGQMVREHLAADIVSANDTRNMVGVSFLTMGPFDDVGNQDPVQAAQIRANTIDDMIVATGSAFLGLTIGCARCHDHKFDPISQSDYYKIQSAYDGARQGSRPVATAAQLQLRGRLLEPLEKERNAINKSLAELEIAFQERVASELKSRPVSISKTPVSPKGVEEKLPDSPFQFLRITIFNNDRNAESAAGTRIDELEILTGEPASQNLALASSGTIIEAPARQPGDFAEAYSPALMIDGKYGAAWVSAATPSVVTIDLKTPRKAEKLVFSSDRNGAIKGKSPYNTFVGDYQVEYSTDGKKWQLLADSSRERPAPSPAHEQARRRRFGYNAKESEKMSQLRQNLASVERKIAAVPNYPTAWQGNFSQPAKPNYIQLGGDPQRRGPEIQPSSPGYLNHLQNELTSFQLAPEAPESSRRLALAGWIASPQNPLTWRVLANRIWHLHFGTGLVDTPSDFGYMGGRPTHPELLDWLAQRLLENGGRLKSLHREIVLSQAYMQSSAGQQKGLAKDAQSRLLWRYPPHRLDSEQIRDSMLFVAGVLDERRGGPGFRLFQYLQDNVATYVSLDDPGPETWRRSVYHQAPRATKVDFLADFDCPDNATPAPSRVTTTTPLQSMTLWNHRFTQRMAAEIAARTEKINDPAARVQMIFQMVYQRMPSGQELAEATEAARNVGWNNLARVLINSNEFLYLE
ncbi:MAG: DUF1553 domain-containing protein [bacterium]